MSPDPVFERSAVLGAGAEVSPEARLDARVVVGAGARIEAGAWLEAGTVVLMRPLPSFSTSNKVPVSATAKLTPETPTSASMNFFRRIRRPIWIS